MTAKVFLAAYHNVIAHQTIDLFTYIVKSMDRCDIFTAYTFIVIYHLFGQSNAPSKDCLLQKLHMEDTHTHIL